MDISYKPNKEPRFIFMFGGSYLDPKDVVTPQDVCDALMLHYKKGLILRAAYITHTGNHWLNMPENFFIDVAGDFLIEYDVITYPDTTVMGYVTELIREHTNCKSFVMEGSNTFIPYYDNYGGISDIFAPTRRI